MYKWLKPKGGMDFVDDFVPPGLEEGIRLDTELNFDPSIANIGADGNLFNDNFTFALSGTITPNSASPFVC